MSLITDFFLAAPEDLAKISFETPSAIYDEFPVVKANRVDPVKLARLESIIAKKELNEIKLSSPILGAEEQWVFSVSEAITRSLATCTSSELEEYAVGWANSAEWQFDRATTEDTLHLLQEIRDLAKIAKRGNKMFVFISV